MAMAMVYFPLTITGASNRRRYQCTKKRRGRKRGERFVFSRFLKGKESLEGWEAGREAAAFLRR